MNANYIELTKDDFIGVVRLVTRVRYEKMQVFSNQTLCKREFFFCLIQSMFI